MINVPSKTKTSTRKTQRLTLFDNSCQCLGYSKIRNIDYYLKTDESINFLSIKMLALFCLKKKGIWSFFSSSFYKSVGYPKIAYMQHCKKMLCGVIYSLKIHRHNQWNNKFFE